MEIVTADIGGTHARFAIARIDAGHVADLGEPMTLKTAAHDSLEDAWAAFGRAIDRPLPRAAGIAIATPIRGEVLKLTNNPWTIRPAVLAERLGLDDHVLVNDFGAVAHAVAEVGPDRLPRLCGPDRPLPADGAISVVGPGTGLGVALLLRTGGTVRVIETEGGHIGFAPVDALEDALLARLRERHGRVSAERIAAGPGLRTLHALLAGMEGVEVPPREDAALWAAALDGSDRLAAAAFDRFCMSLGSIAGDIALAQGAAGVVIAGGLGLRIADRLPASGFAARFVAKGRFEPLMRTLPVRLLTHPQPGLLGAAAAYAHHRAATG